LLSDRFTPPATPPKATGCQRPIGFGATTKIVSQPLGIGKSMINLG